MKVGLKEDAQAHYADFLRISLTVGTYWFQIIITPTQRACPVVKDLVKQNTLDRCVLVVSWEIGGRREERDTC